MSTPTFFIPPPTAEQLHLHLEQELCRQAEATPEVEFPQGDFEHSYHLLCEIEHDTLEPGTVEQLRSGIHDPEYWKCEALCYKEWLTEQIWGKILQEHSIHDDPTTAMDWKMIAMAYRRRLTRQGLSIPKIRERRLSIKNQMYWKPEAECLRLFAARRELEMIQQYWEEKGKSRDVLIDAQSEDQQRFAAENHHQQAVTNRSPPRRSPRSQRIEKRREDSASTRQNSGSKIERRGTTGAKAGRA